MIGQSAPIALRSAAIHPAFYAWKTVDPSAPPPISIEVLKPQQDAGVYRIVGATRTGLAVIAKQRLAGGLAGEARIYNTVLPALDLPALECYGYIDDLHGHSWLFVEDGGSVRYRPDDPAHCVCAIEWLARLHATPRNLVAGLADFGPRYFRGVLDDARDGVRRTISGAAASASREIAAIAYQLDAIERKWPDVEAACMRVPETLVHGDFVRKNLRVRGDGEAAHIVAFDWETAGAGAPACDIAQIPGHADQRRFYFERLRETHASLTLDDVERLFRIGTVFRLLHAIQWETYTFAIARTEQALQNLAAYGRALDEVIGVESWAG